MTKSTNNISADISTNGRKFEKVTTFNYLGATLCKDGTCSAEIRIRIASAMAAVARLNRIRQRNTISFASKFMLYESLITFILPYGCGTWNLLADSEKGIQAFESKCLRKLTGVSFLEHKINDWVRSKINFPVGPNLFWQLSRDGHLHGSGMSHATTASPKPSFSTPRRVGDAVVGRGIAEWTTSKG